MHFTWITLAAFLNMNKGGVAILRREINEKDKSIIKAERDQGLD